MLGFDLETASASELFRYDEDFIRLWGTIGDGNITLGTDVRKLVRALKAAPWIYGHNILGFDLLALVFHHHADWEKLASKSIDTLLLARLDYPPEARDTGGSTDKYDLDHVAERLGLSGKTDDLAKLARRHGGYDKIPVEDPDYRRYLEGDLRASEAILGKLPRGEYARREHKLAVKAGWMTLNGFRVDLPLLEARIAEGEDRRQEALEILRDDYNLPLGLFQQVSPCNPRTEQWESYDNPLTSLEGRKWLIGVYDAYGVVNPPVTEKGRLSISAPDLAPLAENEFIHPDLRRILELIRTITTTRTVYKTVQDHLSGDRVHPMISMGQASGRWSVTSPGLTVLGKRGGRHKERDIFLPEEGHVLLSCDLSQVDMRAIAGHCQDKNYMALFAPGQDAHTGIAIQVFGDPARRHDAKAIGHGANYGLGANKLIAAGHDPELVRKFFANMETSFPGLMTWREKVRESGAAGELLDNGFGRKMRCDPARAYTQAPALMGQGGARDIMCEALLRLPREFNPMLRVMVHDEIVMSVPVRELDEVRREVKKAFTFEWHGVPILSDMSVPGRSWGEVSAK